MSHGEVGQEIVRRRRADAWVRIALLLSHVCEEPANPIGVAAFGPV